ncbi:hypothetical protein AVEN_91792-1 [Araneus ventricosus]|uniref:Uncharacterized protein n=1 Tax=Araneus ventricosus TaxID=182803 RepID=A0A4Y2TXJ2_ARAVE|nr:hypothetical protein AVEN_91792-1 [Araneus ventricosus]
MFRSGSHGDLRCLLYCLRRPFTWPNHLCHCEESLPPALPVHSITRSRARKSWRSPRLSVILPLEEFYLLLQSLLVTVKKAITALPAHSQQCSGSEVIASPEGLYCFRRIFHLLLLSILSLRRRKPSLLFPVHLNNNVQVRSHMISCCSLYCL